MHRSSLPDNAPTLPLRRTLTRAILVTLFTLLISVSCSKGSSSSDQPTESSVSKEKAPTKKAKTPKRPKANAKTKKAERSTSPTSRVASKPKSKTKTPAKNRPSQAKKAAPAAGPAKKEQKRPTWTPPKGPNLKKNRVLNQPPPSPASRPLDITPIINREKIAVLLNAEKGFLPRSLSGQIPSSGYNHTRMVPRGASPNALGLVAQVWRDLRIPDARQRFDAFISSYPTAKKNSTITPKTFFARYGDRKYIGFLETSQKITVVLACDDVTCTSEQLLNIAKSVHKNLSRIH